MEYKLKSFFQKNAPGVTLVEVMVVLLLLSLSFLVFLQALNTGKTVRARSELRTVQAVLLNSLEQEIRARRFDENTSPPWSASLGSDAGTFHLSFDGNNDYITVSNDLRQWLGVTSSLSVWFKTTMTGHNTMWLAPGITGTEQAGGGNDIFWGWIDASGKIGFTKGNGTAIKSTGPVNNDEWHHLAITYNVSSGYTELYLDGTLNNSGTTSSGAVTTAFYSIGRIEDTGGTPTYFNGGIDEFAIWDEALTSAEITALYNSGSGLDATANYGNYSSASNLVGYWQMNEGTGTTAYDGSGNNNSGSLIGNTAWASSSMAEGNSIELWDDIDDFHNYSLESIDSTPFGCTVEVNYVDAASAFHQSHNSPTNYKSVTVKITHPTLPTLTDTMVISPGL